MEFTNLQSNSSHSHSREANVYVSLIEVAGLHKELAALEQEI